MSERRGAKREGKKREREVNIYILTILFYNLTILFYNLSENFHISF